MLATGLCCPAAVIVVALGGAVSAAMAAYDEPYRPQYHFSVKEGSVGDPDGLVRHKGLFHLFWWGHAVSDDLVHWKEMPRPLRGGDDSFQYFSGSVVVDRENTGGFGAEGVPAWVAVYTAHRRSDGFDDQRISVSRDGVYYDYYRGNPVLSLPGMPCRDPDVFWHAGTGRWVMALAVPEKHKVLFYSSADLKTWDYASEFGPAGARAGNWEVPNLLRLREEGGDGVRWVLACSVGPNKIQYFPGEFDGTRFVMDAKTREFLESGVGLQGEVFADFEPGGATDGWGAEGDAFQAPVSGPSERFTGYLGRKFVRSNIPGNSAVGRLVSPEFPITRRNINFLLAGTGKPEDVAVRLLVDGRVVRSTGGDSSGALKWRGWDVSELAGQLGQIEIIDRGKEGGFIAVDHIMFSETLMDTGRENANWVDWGSDFYAARAWRDADSDVPEEHWIGWMGNWEYANDVPTSWGKGAESVPRQLHVAPSPRGWQLVQRPLPALQKLRGELHEAGPLEVSGVMDVPEFKPERNTYELEAVFDLVGAAGRFGFNLFAGGKQKVVVGYDVAARNVFLDRRESGDVSFSRAFPSVKSAPLLEPARTLRLRIFVDQSSIEVFADDGAAVLTSVVFPNASGTGVQLFASGGSVTLQSLKAWPLRSIWENQAAAGKPVRFQQLFLADTGGRR